MCAEGIRIGRRTTARTVRVTPNNADGVLALPRREDRIAILVAMPINAVPTALFFPTANVRNYSRFARGTFAELNAYAPTFTATIEEFGEVVRNEIWIGGGADPVHVTEVYLIDTLEQAASK